MPELMKERPPQLSLPIESTKIFEPQIQAEQRELVTSSCDDALAE